MEQLIEQNLKNFGLKAFGMNMPVVSRKWLDVSATDVSAQLSFDAATLTLTSAATNWLSPMGGFVRLISAAEPIDLTLTGADGAPVRSQGLLLEIPPTAHLRQRRLMANLLEDETPHNPQRSNGFSLRPVPRYFHFAGTPAVGTKSGQVVAGDDLGLFGSLQIFDSDGHVIDPLAVISWVTALLGAHPPLVADDGADDQLASIEGLEAADTFRVRMVNHDGTPHDGAHFGDNLNLTGTGVSAATGVFTAKDFTGSDAEILREFNRDAATAATGSFPPEEADFLLFGPSTYGRLGTQLRLPALPAGRTISHDFFSLRVVELKSYLLGTANPAFKGSVREPRPKVRINEVIELGDHGNALLGKLAEVMDGTPDDALLVAETVETDFALPTDPDVTTFPAFPTLPGGTTVENEAFPVDLKAQITAASTAEFVQDGGAGFNPDILLTLIGVPIGASVRAYNRKVGIDMTELRGDGGGGVVTEDVSAVAGRTYNGRLRLLLEDPLGLLTDGSFTAPVNPILNVDIVIVQQDGERRIYGNIELPLTAGAAIPNPLPAIDNGLGGVARRGIAPSGLSGLTTPDITPTDDAIETALNYLDGNTPDGRVAPRLPLMLRRDVIAASRRGTAWRGLLGGGQIAPRLYSEASRYGAPNNPGSPEAQSTGLYTQNGRLAYDLGRHAFRRTESAYTRVPALQSDDWDIPAQPTALATGVAQSDDAGPFAATVLQTVSPFVETPELGLLKSVLDNDSINIPPTFDGLVDWLVAQVNAINIPSLPGPVQTGINRIKAEVVDWLVARKADGTLSGFQMERIYDEITRELSAASYGRRDSQWALEAAIKNARHFIYLETPALAPTKYGVAGPEYSVDFWALIQAQLTAQPGLRVIIWTPKQPPFAPGYAELAAKEVFDRFRLFAPAADAAGTTSPVVDDGRVVIFHPVGFPGRPSALDTQTVIVDDKWLLTGSTTFRRRGLTFDGGTDVALTGYDRLDGAVPQIRAHRVALLRERLNLGLSDKTTLLQSSTARLRDGRESFFLVREMLIAGGYGAIERLWDGRDPHLAYTAPTADESIANPEGQTFNAALGAFRAWVSGLGRVGGGFHDL